MSEQLWNFAGIEGGAGEIQSSVGTTASLLEEGHASLAKLAGVWGGTGSESYQAVQRNWDEASAELNTALAQLANTIREAGSTMAQTENSVAASFGA